MSKKCPSNGKKSQCQHDSETSQRIAERAYYIAENRRFEPGHELDDWLEAESFVKSDTGMEHSMPGFHG